MRKKRLELSRSDREELDRIQKESPKHYERDKAKALLLLADGKMIKELVDIFNVERNTIGKWRKEWEEERKISIKKGRGRKEMLSNEIQDDIHSTVKEYPNNLKEVHRIIQDRYNIVFSIDTLRKVIKKN